MSAHTPGPWVLEQDGDVYVRLAPDNVIRCMDERSDVAISQDYANARLIAAAPDLLAALQVALHALENARLEYDYHGNPMDKCDADVIAAVDTLRAVIAKATGDAA